MEDWDLKNVMQIFLSILISMLENFLFYFLTGALPKPPRCTREKVAFDLVLQSGEIARSKYQRKKERKKAEILRSLKVVQSKKNKMSKAQLGKSDIDSALNAIKGRLESFKFQSGEADNRHFTGPFDLPDLTGDPYGVDDEPLPQYFWGVLSTCTIFQPVMWCTNFMRQQITLGNIAVRNLWFLNGFERDIRASQSYPSWYQSFKWFFVQYSSHSTIDHIENMITLAAGLWTSTSAINATALIIAHLKIYHQASIVETLLSTWGDRILMHPDFAPIDEWDFQSSMHPTNSKKRKKRGNRKEYEMQDGDFLDLMRGSIKNWKLLKHSKFVRYMIDLIAILVSSTMCSILSLDFNVAGIPLFSESLKKRLDAMNIVDTGELVLEATSYFMDVGYLCFTQKSFKPILYTDTESFSFDQRYVNYIANYSGAFDSDWDTIGFTEHQYIQENAELTSYYTSLHSVISRGPEKIQIFQRMAQLAKLRMELTRRINSSGMRVSPYVMLIFGSSSVGKTSVASILNTIAIQMCDGTGDPAKRVTSNENDKYFSGYMADTESVVMDDICNTNSNFLQTSPLANLIKWANNNPELAIMADLDSKGKISIRPKTILLTSNVNDLNASVFSVEPVSILRRLNVHVTVKVKDEFALQNGTGQKMMDPFKANAYVATLPPHLKDLPDLWNITLSRVVTKASSVVGRPDEGYFEPIWYGKKTLTDISIAEAADYIAKDSRLHKLSQVKIVDGQSTLHERLTVCKECANLSFNCTCLKKQSGDDGAVISGVDFAQLYESDINDGGTGQCASALFCTTQHFGEPLPEVNKHNRFELLPKWLCFSNIGVFPAILVSLAFVTQSFMVLLLGTSSFVFFIGPWVTYAYRRFFWWYNMWRYGVRYTRFLTCVGNDICEQAKKLKDHLINTKEGRIYVAGTATLFSSWLVFKLVKMLFKGAKAYKAQSKLQPDEEEYNIRRNSPSAWFSSHVKPMKGSHTSSTTTWESLSAIRERNHVFVKWGTKVCGGFMVKTHFLLLPNHFLSEDASLLVKVNGDNGNNTHECKCQVSEELSYHIPDTDLRLWYLPTGGDFKDLEDYFPDGPVKDSWAARFAFRDQQGKIQRDITRCTPEFIDVQGIKYNGLKYTLRECITFRGMCMASLVNEGKHPKIIGFHLGGVVDTKHGAAGYVTRSQLKVAFDKLHRVGVLHVASSDCIDDMQFAHRRDNQSYMLQGAIKPQCPTNYLPPGSNIEVLGSCLGGATRSSQVIVSHISESVSDIFGIDRMHGKAPLGPPAVPKWHPWQLGMQGFSDISQGPYSAVLCKAAEDYLGDILGFAAPTEILDLATIVNGLDNDKFINRMPQNTSVGFPLSGPLNKVCELVEPTAGHAVNFTIADDIYDEFVKCENLLSQGKRIYAVYRASLKDEPRPLGSTKARVFQAAPLVLKMLLRKYYLPLVARMSMFPLMSECAVGINALSDEWDEMHHHIIKYGEDSIVAGDYSAYDQRMSPSLTSAAFDILIKFAAACGYDSKCLKIMQSLSTEVIYPMVAYDGTLVKIMGSNPSGHNLTVYVNSIANSLISRCAFFTMYPKHSRFKDAVSMMTYGDDDIGSVNEEFGLYNNISKSDYITSIGMKYTPPSKSGEHVKLMSMSEVDFLKRKSIFNVDKDRYMGALEEASIYKSLHCRMRSTEISDSQWAGSVCDAALREVFPRGRENYVDMQQKLTKLADRHDFLHHCVNLLDTYEECGDKIG